MQITIFKSDSLNRQIVVERKLMLNDEGMIVMFNALGVGVVLDCGDTDWWIGSQYNDPDLTGFVDFNGSIDIRNK